MTRKKQKTIKARALRKALGISFIDAHRLAGGRPWGEIGGKYPHLTLGRETVLGEGRMIVEAVVKDGKEVARVVDGKVQLVAT